MTIITEVIVVALLISLILATLRRIYDWMFSRSNIPSPPAYPILRHLPYFWTSFNDEKMLRLWAEDFKAQGIFEYDILLGEKRICIFKEEYVRKVLVSNCMKYERGQLLGDIFPKTETGMFLANGKEHAWQRKILTPVFTHASVLEFVKTFDENTENLIKHWRNTMKTSLTGIAEVDILKDFNMLALDTIGEAAFGYRFDTLISGENEVSQAVETLLRGKISATALFLRRIVPFYDWLPFQENRMMNKATNLTDSVVKQIIREKRSEMEKSGGKVSGNNLLSKMLMVQDEESGRRLSDQMIEAQVHTFMVAGHETTSVALTWTFYLLAKHQDVQEKARQEAIAVFGGSGAIDNTHLDELKYITAVINESLRMYPPAALFMRKVVADDQLGEYKIPKGSYVVVPICVLHHLEENWVDHEKFSPERFLGDQQISNYKFMPFSNGPRNCIGRKFAMLEMKVAISKLLMKFKFDLDPSQGELNTQLRLTLKPNPRPMLRVSLIEC